MSFNRDPDAGLQQLYCRVVSSNAALQEPGIATSMIRRKIAEQLADSVAHDTVTETRGKYETVYEARIYVLTPEQLEKYVQRRAEQLSPHIPWVRYQ